MEDYNKRLKEKNDLRIKSIMDRTSTIYDSLASAIEVIIYTSTDKRGQLSHLVACYRVRMFLYGLLSSHTITRHMIKHIFKRVLVDKKTQRVIFILSKE